MKFQQHFKQQLLKKQTIEQLSELYKRRNLLWDEMEAKEQLFENVHFFKRCVHELFSKYYLKNRNCEGNINIQESVKKKIQHLNKAYSQNKYFFNVKQETVDKKENKYVYNNYTIFITEFQHTNLNDIIRCTNLLDTISLPVERKMEIVESLEKFIKLNRKKMRQIDRQNKGTEYHDDLISQIEKFLHDEIYKIYDNVLGMRVNEIVSKHLPYFSTMRKVDLISLCDDLPDKVIKEIATIYVELGLDEKSWWININQISGPEDCSHGK